MVRQGVTSLPGEEVLVRAVHFFSTENLRPVSQSARVATFQGQPPVPWFMILLMFLGFLVCIVPGIIFYVLVVKKARQFHTLVVTVSPINGGSQVSVQYTEAAGVSAHRFLAMLPPHVMAGQTQPLPALQGPPQQPMEPPIALRQIPATNAQSTAVGVSQPPRFCSGCGLEIQDEAKFCSKCGRGQT
jgi:hypothetical protein